MGFSISGRYWMLFLFAVPYGLGAGSIDVACNHYVANHYSSSVMNFLHCFYGVGAVISPCIMSLALKLARWNEGYRWTSYIQLGILLVCVLSLPLWRKNDSQDDSEIRESAGIGRTLAVPGVLLTLIAFFAFREKLSKQLLAAIALVTVASITLSFEGMGSLRFNTGSLLVLGAACCWGLENNCTRMLSNKSSVQITTIKGIFSGIGSLIVALVVGEQLPGIVWMLAVMILGFVAYGLSINFYIKAQKELGAAKTSAYYSVAPFLGVLFGVLLLREQPGVRFYVGLAIMIVATVLMVKDSISLQHTHEHTHVHTHEHSHGGLRHIHEHAHVHSHTHIHGADEAAHSHTHGSMEEHNHSHIGET